MRKYLLLLVFVMLAFTGAMIWMTRGQDADAPPLADSGTAQIGGSFRLTDQNGKTVSDSDFRGKPMLVFFGFTHCPDICPTTLATYSAALNALGEQAKGVTPIFITVDPERDTPARLKEYLANFHPAVIGLTGTREQIEAVSKQYKAYYSVAETPKPEAQGHEGHGEHHAVPKDNYMVNHSSLVYLMNARGEYVSHFNFDAPAETLVDAVKAQLR